LARPSEADELGLRKLFATMRRFIDDATYLGTQQQERLLPQHDVPPSPSEVSRLGRFTAVGLINTGVDLSLFTLLRLVADAPLLWANSIAFSAAVTCGFFLNRRWTFADRVHAGQPMGRQYVVFLGLACGGLMLSNAAVLALSQSLSDLASKLISFVFIFVWNYSTSRFLVFRREPSTA
ncbi:MAG: GtrA family protein, partial [Pseudomonadota bacterium]